MARSGNTITGLSIPVPGIGGDSGSDAASALVTSLDVLDEHDHTADNGALITPAALNINDDLDFNGQAATNVQKVVLTEQGSSPTDLNSIYSKNDGELYYKDDAGNEVQLTVGGLVNVGGTGSLSFVGTKGAAGVSYTSASYAWAALPHDGASGAFADMNVKGLLLNGATSGVITVKPAAATTTYNLTLPSAAPTANTFPMSDGSGVLGWQAACVNGGTAAAHRVAVWESTTAIKGVALTDGQILIGATAATPAAASITGTTNRITVTNGANSITLNTPQDLHTSANVQFAQATLSTIAGSPTSALGNTTITGTLNVSGNATLTTMTGTGTRVAYVNSSGQFVPGVAATALDTADTVVLRGSSKEIAVGAITCTGVVCTGNVDGRDVSVDGTKLDTIASGLWTPTTSFVSGSGVVYLATYMKVGNTVTVCVYGNWNSNGSNGVYITLPSGAVPTGNYYWGGGTVANGNDTVGGCIVGQHAGVVKLYVYATSITGAPAVRFFAHATYSLVQS